MPTFNCPACQQQIRRDLPKRAFQAKEEGYFVETVCYYCPECNKPLKPAFRLSGLLAFLFIAVIGLPICLLTSISLWWFTGPVLAAGFYAIHQIQHAKQPYIIDERF